jgi:hypothetical protein
MNRHIPLTEHEPALVPARLSWPSSGRALPQARPLLKVSAAMAHFPTDTSVRLGVKVICVTAMAAIDQSQRLYFNVGVFIQLALRLGWPCLRTKAQGPWHKGVCFYLLPPFGDTSYTISPRRPRQVPGQFPNRLGVIHKNASDWFYK